MEDKWRHIQETVNMLYLAVCQIEATMSDSNKSVDTLTHSFTHLANHTSQVTSKLQNLSDPNALESFKNDLACTAQDMHSNISASVQAFQFYDRVCQRLDHIANSLQKVAGIVGNERERNSEVAWEKIQEDIKNSYSMEAERIMFEHIMRGASIEDALNTYRHHFNEGGGTIDRDGDEIELF